MKKCQSTRFKTETESESDAINQNTFLNSDISWVNILVLIVIYLFYFKCKLIKLSVLINCLFVLYSALCLMYTVYCLLSMSKQPDLPWTCSALVSLEKHTL